MQTIEIIVLGGSGSLSALKIFPALFAIYSQNLFPDKVRFFAYARSRMTQKEFKDKIRKNLTCRYTPEHSCNEYIENFLEKCQYCNGAYDKKEAYEKLKNSLDRESEKIFYLALPPEIFPSVAEAGAKAGLFEKHGKTWPKLVVEKPLGRDRKSSDKLNSELLKFFNEKQIYRIDHYLGKEMVQNLLILRFANEIFNPLWNRKYIESIEINWQEDIGTEGRAGYFDNYGIIRDVIQNHMIQILALIIMDEPKSLKADDIRDAKLAVLKKIPTLSVNDFILGQYTSGFKNGKKILGYLEDSNIPDNSTTPTYAKVDIKVDSDKWKNVPIRIRAGKAMPKKKTEIRIRFKSPEGNIFCDMKNCPPANELIIRIQPNEGIHFNIVSKTPGLKMQFQTKDLDLSYKSAFSTSMIPEAYESLILDIVNGEKALFIRKDELQAAWDIFTPALKKMESEKIKPIPYPFGCVGPSGKSEKKCACGRKLCRKNYNSPL